STRFFRRRLRRDHFAQRRAGGLLRIATERDHAVIGLGYALVGTGFALNAFAHTVPALVIAMTVVTFGEMLTIPVSVAYVADLAPAHMRGRYMGAFGLTWALGLTVGPDLGMTLYHFGAAAVWLSCRAPGL